jgi:hypothetical protein
MLRPTHEQMTSERRDGFDLRDVDMLELLLHVRITHDDDAAVVQAAYEEHRSTQPAIPTFEELLDQGWFRVAWRRITSELDTHLRARRQGNSLRDALAVVLAGPSREGVEFAFDDISSLSEAARPIATRLVSSQNK